MKKIRVGIVGGTGYTGVELIRLLSQHPAVDLKCVTSRSERGQRIDQWFPNLHGTCDLSFTDVDLGELSRCDMVFFATPHAVAMHAIPALLDQGVRVIDLSADFRLRDPVQWQQWYGEAHACPEILSEAVYGLPEINRAAIKQAQLVANPGCYPTAIQLGFLPILQQPWADLNYLIADAKSGVSGAGRVAKMPYAFCEATENFQAYAVSGHRHWPEISQGLNTAAGKKVQLTFVPHLVPMVRGILATLYVPLLEDIAPAALQKLYEEYYAEENFTQVLPWGSHPQTRTVRGGNVCQIALHRPAQSNQLIIVSVIDNLVKGASGQAVQNMNIMLGLSETMGLDTLSCFP